MHFQLSTIQYIQKGFALDIDNFLGLGNGLAYLRAVFQVCITMKNQDQANDDSIDKPWSPHANFLSHYQQFLELHFFSI